jgi:hypothetical protein
MLVASYPFVLLNIFGLPLQISFLKMLNYRLVSSQVQAWLEQSSSAV